MGDGCCSTAAEKDRQSTWRIAPLFTSEDSAIEVAGSLEIVDGERQMKRMPRRGPCVDLKLHSGNLLDHGRLAAHWRRLRATPRRPHAPTPEGLEGCRHPERFPHAPGRRDALHQWARHCAAAERSIHALHAGALHRHPQHPGGRHCVRSTKSGFASQLHWAMPARLVLALAVLAASAPPCTDGQPAPSGAAMAGGAGWPRSCDSPFARPSACADGRDGRAEEHVRTFVLLLNSFEKLTWATVGLGRLLAMANSSLGVSLVEPCVADSGTCTRLLHVLWASPSGRCHCSRAARFVGTLHHVHVVPEGGAVSR